MIRNVVAVITRLAKTAREVLPCRVHGAAAWWMAGARATLPSRWLKAVFAEDDTPVLMVSPENGSARAVWAGGPAKNRGMADDILIPRGALPSWIAARGLARADVRIWLVLDPELVFTRRLAIPRDALATLSALLDQEVEMRTPFLPNEIWHGATRADGAALVREVTHWIVRRDYVTRTLGTAGLSDGDIDALATRMPDGRVISIIPLRPQVAAAGDAGGRIPRMPLVIATAVTVLTLVGTDGIGAYREGRLSSELTAARERLDGSASNMRELRILLALKAAPGLGQIWAELSRLLPDDTFLVDMKFDDGIVTLTGFSAGPANLVRTIDASPLFAAATLSGTIEPDARGKQRFTLTTELRGRPRRGAVAAIRDSGKPL